MENQTSIDKNKDFILDGDSVPLYDRGYALGLTSADGSSNLDGYSSLLFKDETVVVLSLPILDGSCDMTCESIYFLLIS